MRKNNTSGNYISGFTGMPIQGLLERLWYERHPLSLLLIPISWIYTLCIHIRRFAYNSGLLPKNELPVALIVVGNITVGGTGKTPVVLWLSEYLVQLGYKPGILSRGYGAYAGDKPQQVRPDSDPYTVGDEPVLLARRSGRPVAVAKDRYKAATELLEHTDSNVLLSDDGLQHLSVERDIEILVIDGDRRFGNGFCLPAGPLREPVQRTASVDIVISKEKAGKNEFLMQYEYGEPVSLLDEKKSSFEYFQNKSVHVVSGISNPRRFHMHLKSRGMMIITHEFPDHYLFQKSDLVFDDDLPVFMTEKDAVKCKKFGLDKLWYVPVTAGFSETFRHRIKLLLEEVLNG